MPKPKFWYPQLKSGLVSTAKVGVVKTVLLANGHFAWVTPSHFRHFRRSPESEEQKPLFLWVEYTIRVFADFRYTHLFSAGEKNLVFSARGQISPKPPVTQIWVSAAAPYENPTLIGVQDRFPINLRTFWRCAPLT